MNKILKYGLIVLAGLIVIVAAGVGFIAATFDPNAYKPQIVKAVKEQKDRSLSLPGDIRLSFFPNLGVDLGRLSLSEHKSEQEFAAVDGARVSLAVMPLLRKEVVVNEITVKGLKANLVKFKDGRLNIDDLISKEEKGGQVKFDIDHVLLENATLTYRDEARGARYELGNVNLKTGRIAAGVSTPVELSFSLAANQPKLALATQVKTRLSFDLDKQYYALEGLALESKGEAAGIRNFALKAGGDASASPAAQEFTAEKLSLALTGNVGKDAVEAKLEAPRLQLTKDRFGGDKVTASAKLPGISAALVLPGLEGTVEAFRSGPMTLDVESKQGEQSIKLRLTSPLSGNFQAQRVSLPQLALSISASGPNLPGKSIGGELRGTGSVDGAKQLAQASLAGKVGDSNIKAKVGVAGFGKPAITLDADIDRLDLDAYLPAKKAEAKDAKPEQPLDFSFLKSVNASGSVRIGALTAAKMKASQVRVDFRAGNGRLDLSPLSAKLYEGAMSGSLNVAAAGPAVALKQNLSGISVGPLLRDLADQDRLEGKGSVSVDVTAQGATVSAMKKALNGTAALSLADGAIKGIDIASAIRGAKAKLGLAKGEQAVTPGKAEQTDFTELKGSFVIRNGVARNEDLSMKSPLLRVGGAGDINIGAETLDYLLKATVVATTAGQGGRELADLKGVTVPVKISGAWAAPSYRLDFGAMASEAAKAKVETKKEEVKTKVEDKLKDRLKGLFR
ncbi:MAG: AsmA family protein [Betaproteobacteria bacterium]|nr:AsmA family protein [Betaproteobacteria bacterium]